MLFIGLTFLVFVANKRLSCKNLYSVFDGL